MALPSDLLPPSHDWIAAQFADMRREIAELRAARTAEATTIGRNGLTIDNSGSLAMIDDNGVKILYAGPGPDGRQQFSLRRDGGSHVFDIFANDIDEPMYWSLVDRDGRDLVTDDPVSDIGLGKPWLHFSMHPLFAMAAGTFPYMNIAVSSVTSTTVLWEGRIGLVCQPKVSVSGIFGQATGSNTQTYTLKELGGATIGTITPGATLVNTTVTFDLTPFMDRVEFPIQLTALASGSGSIACQILGCWQRGTIG